MRVRDDETWSKQFEIKSCCVETFGLNYVCVWQDHVNRVRYYDMDENALLDLGPVADPQARQRAMQYFEQLKISDTGWQLCASAITNGTCTSNDHAKFFCFQVVEHYLKTRYKSATTEEHEQVKSFLLTWLQLHCANPDSNASFIRNKAAQLFALAFVCDYPKRWPGLFEDLLRGLKSGGEEALVDMYLRVLTTIDTEVVDRDIPHTAEECRRNTELKDLMRIRSVPTLVDSWYHIATTYEETAPQLTCQCLDVIGLYISWIDINLIANDRFVSALLRFLGMPLVRESACDCVHEIIGKGMEPVAKVELIESFASALHGAGLLAVDEDDEGDYLAKLARLVNGIGLQLITAWEKLCKNKDEVNMKAALTALDSKVALMLRFLGNEDDDVSGAVIPFAHDYISVVKQLAASDHITAQLKELLVIVITKMKYDESYSFDHEGEDEAMFDEYRKELKIIINNVGNLDSDLLLSTCKELMTSNLGQWHEADFSDVEVAIALLYQLCEALPGSLSQQFSGDNDKSTEMQTLMRLLVSSNVSCYRHRAVTLQFFETVVRYDKFFNTEPQHIPHVLTAFLDERGLRNSSPMVRSRTSYLFSRFVKAISKQHIQAYLEEILTQVHDLLLLVSPDNGVKHYLSSDDQMFMYETAGVLIVQSHFEPQRKYELMTRLLAPIVTKFDGLLQQMLNERNEGSQLAYADCLVNAMKFASRASKGFSVQQTMKSCNCVEAYTETLTVFCKALDTPVHRQRLHQGVRQFLHRMVVCLDAEILPYFPVAMEKLLKNADARELYDFLPLINQVINKFKGDIVPFLQEVFMSIVTRVFDVLSAATDVTDQVLQEDKRSLQRGYFTFLSTLVNNNVTEVLSNQASENLHRVLMTVIEGGVQLNDPVSQKTCFHVLRRLVEAWCVDGGGLAGFTDFAYSHVVPACFMAPLRPEFNLSDARTVQALNECSHCLKSLYQVRGDEFIEYLHINYLPSLNLSPELVQEFCTALKSDPKVFKNYFQSFFLRAKS